MRTVLGVSFSLLAALSLGSACGTGGSGGSGGSGATTSASSTSSTTSSGGAAPGSLASDYCQPLAALVCQRAASCGCGAILPAGQLDEAACAAGYAQKCLDAYQQLASAVAAGQARILTGAAHACVELIAADTPGCERPRGSVARGLCPIWFTADTAVGDACDFPVCADTAGVCTAGTCGARPGAGQPCPGQLCTDGLLCLGGACVAPAVAGAACDDDAACAPPLRCVGGACRALAPAAGACTQDAECALGLTCSAGACAAGPATGCSSAAPCGNLSLCAARRACVPKGLAGAACEGDDACADGFFCDGAAHACAASPGPGLPCANGVSCAMGLACDPAQSSCAALPTDGQPCALGPLGPFLCAADLGCTDAGTCGALPGDGQPCTIDSRCAAGLGCDFTSTVSVCGALEPAGGSCQTDRTCQAGLYCDYHVNACAPVLPAGAPCADGNECGPAGSCLPGSGGQFQCAKLPALGDACLFDCAAGLTCAADATKSTCVPEVCQEI